MDPNPHNDAHIAYIIILIFMIILYLAELFRIGAAS